MMKTNKPGLTWLFAILACLVCLTSCEEDLRDVMLDDTSWVSGRWRVVETSDGSAYAPDDIWELRPDGEFYAYGYPDLNESGYWDTEGSRLLIAVGSSDISMEAIVSNYSNGYMVLDVYDYDYGRYTLRLVQEVTYSQRRKTD